MKARIKESPMAKMRPPKVPEQPVPVLKEDQLRALLATCEKGSSLRIGVMPRCCASSWTPELDGPKWPTCVTTRQMT